jgi:hypothetical protein
MKVLDATVNWNFGLGNSPDLYVLVDKFPPREDMRYAHKDGIFYAEAHGYASFYSWTRPGDGFGGRVFELTMEDGTVRSLKGPWSSNAGSVNLMGFGPCMEVTMTDDPDVWRKGHTFFASAMTIDRIWDVLGDFCPYATLVEDEEYGWYNIQPDQDRKKPDPPPMWDLRWGEQFGKYSILSDFRGTERFAGLKRETDEQVKAMKAADWGKTQLGKNQRLAFISAAVYQQSRKDDKCQIWTMGHKVADSFAEYYDKGWNALFIEQWWRERTIRAIGKANDWLNEQAGPLEELCIQGQIGVQVVKNRTLAPKGQESRPDPIPFGEGVQL